MASPVHAAEKGAQATLCDLPTDGLVMFQPWDSIAGGAKCDECREKADPAT